MGLKECVCIYICDFMIMVKTVYSTRLLSPPPMTGSWDVNQEVKIGSEKCYCTSDPERCTAAAQTFKNEFYFTILLRSDRNVLGDADPW